MLRNGVIAINTAPPQKLPSRAKQRGRLGTVACGLFVCVLCGWFGLLSAQPYLLAMRLRAENDALERKTRWYYQENQRAEKEVKALDTPEGVMRAARKLGYVLPGEQRLRLPETK